MEKKKGDELHMQTHKIKERVQGANTACDRGSSYFVG